MKYILFGMENILMKAVVLYGPNDFRVEEIDRPIIGDDELLIKMERAAICGTDIRIFRLKRGRPLPRR